MKKAALLFILFYSFLFSQAQIAVTTVIQQTKCYGDSNGIITAHATGGVPPYQFQLAGRGPFASDSVFSGLKEGVYSIVVTDNGGNTAILLSTINDIAYIQPYYYIDGTLPDSALGYIHIVAVAGGTTPYTYLWSNLSTDTAINSLAEGNYTVTITDANNCSNSFTWYVTVPNGLAYGTTNPINSIMAYGDSAGIIACNASGGTPPYQYQLRNHITGGVSQSINDTFANVPAGVYDLIFTDANPQDTSVFLIVFTQPAEPLFVTGYAVNNTACGNGQIALTVTGGRQPYDFWSSGYPFTPETQNSDSLIAGNYSIACLDFLSNQNVSFTIGGPPTITVNSIITPDNNCPPHQGGIDLAVSGGTPPYSFAWSPNAGTTNSLSGLAAGWYTLTLTDQGGCDFVSHYEVGVQQCPTNQPVFYGISFNDSAIGASSSTISPGSLFSFGSVVNSYAGVHTFGNAGDGADPTLLYQTITGKLYGTTGQGTTALYSYDPATNSYNSCLDFSNLNTAFVSNYCLAEAYDGKLYGVTDTGGANNAGFVFMRDTLSACSKALDLALNSGSRPNTDLLPVPDGRLFGTMRQGGANGYGDIYSYDPAANVYTDVYDFNNTGGPANILLVASNGSLYGTADSGSADYGSLYRFYPFAHHDFIGYQKLYSFSDTSGYMPDAMLQLSNNNLLGITHAGGSVILGLGAIFTYNISTATFTKVFDFDTTTGGGVSSNLMQASNGKVYGITHAGGSVILGYGNIFSFDVNTNTFTSLFALNAVSGYGAGFSNSAYIMQASDGNIYGVLHDGGNNHSGTIFTYNLTNNTFTKLFDFDSVHAGNPIHIVQALNTITGVQPLGKNNFQVRLYPNPASDQLTIESDAFLTDKPVIKLTDATGRQLNVYCNWNGDRIILNTSALSQGFYLITIQVNDAVFGGRFVKE